MAGPESADQDDVGVDLDQAPTDPLAKQLQAKLDVAEAEVRHRGGGPAGLVPGPEPHATIPAREPLRWQFRALEACTVHAVRLQEVCPTPGCGRKRAGS